MSRDELEQLVRAGTIPPDAEILSDLNPQWLPLAAILMKPATRPRPQSGPVSRTGSPSKLDQWFAETMPAPAAEPETTDPGSSFAPTTTAASGTDWTSYFGWVVDPWLWSAVVILAGCNLVWFWLQPRPNLVDRERVQEVVSMLDEVRQKRAARISNEEWEKFADALTERAEMMLEELDGETQAPARQCLQWLLQYRLPKVLKYGRYRLSYQEAACEHLLEEAQRHLNKHR